MIRVIGLVLLAAASAFGQAKKAAAPDDVAAVKQVEREWWDAQKSNDAAKVASILADDWVGLETDGTSESKGQFVESVKSGMDKLLSVTLGPMDVKVVGNVAIVQGSDVEKSTSGKRDTSGKWVWMDVFVKRDGKWQAVRSQSAKVK